MKNFFKIITDFIADISLDLFAIFLCMLFVYKTGPSIGVISFFIALIIYIIRFEVQIQRNKTEQLKKN
ncbi:hypothetical protein AEU03_11770 [Salmonella enterica subsp. enterica serovar Muenchen]|uniref:hypothetical protein n=1 Tax=Salmonella enterica TaxID=28901 RepID=UPI00069B56B6|nr:hypothetical protein [Salmonella enterica]KNI16687.1 hypothetical protein AEU03_11770 [Salmonella enterica subsp. enterica serovar Muenchen]